MNEALFRLVNQSIKNPVFDAVLPVFSDKDYVVIPGIIVVVAALYFGSRHVRTGILALLLAILAADAGSEKVLKNIFKERRPYARIEGVNLHRGGKWTVYDPAWYAFDKRKSNSFPSSHAANVATLAVALAFVSRRTLWATVPVALMAGLSRVYTGNHFPGDVLAGYAWGGLCGFGMSLLCPWAVRRVWGEPPEHDVPRQAAPERKLFLWILGLWTAANFWFVYMGPFCLAGDEAQYWDWSRRLALGYYSKPPLIAYIMRLLTNAGGNKEWAIRSGAVLFTSGALAFTYALTLRIAKSERAALLAATAVLLMPSSWAGSVLMTIDAPLAFFWILAMYAFHRAVNGSKAMWWLTGLALGLGMLAKYTMVLLPVSFLLYVLAVDRRPLRTPGPYIALALMFLCLSGVLYWNASNDWVSIRHTASIGTGDGQSIGKALGHFLEFLGSQAGIMVSPILFGFYIWAIAVLARRFRQDRDAAYLFLCFTLLFGSYALVAFTRRPQPNWPVCAYMAAAPALGWVWCERERGPRMRKLLTAGLALGCVLGVSARSTDLLYLATAPFADDEKPDRIHLAGLLIDPDKDPTNSMVGGRELGAALSDHIGQHGVDAPFIFSDRYQLTAWGAFYTEGRPRTYCINLDGRRYNQYDMWGGWGALAGRDGLFIRGGNEMKARYFVHAMVQADVFERGEYLETIEVRRGKTTVRTFTISRLYNCSGVEPIQEERKY